MIRQEICYPNLNVKIACSHGGVTPANDGASHQAIEDMGVLRTIPNMTVIMPADYWSARKLVAAAANTYGPMFLRFTRDAIPVIYDENTEFTIGKAHQLRDGKDVAIIANGDTVCLALEAAEELKKQGVSVKLLDMHTIKPLDVEAVKDCVENIGKIITVEDTTSSTALAVPSAKSQQNWAKVRSNASASRITSANLLRISVCWPRMALRSRISSRRPNRYCRKHSLLLHSKVGCSILRFKHHTYHTSHITHHTPGYFGTMRRSHKNCL